MEDIQLRWATLADIPLIVETIIASEKSGTDILPLATMFGITEEVVRECLVQILEEEEPGCEFSLSSYVVAEQNGVAGAALGGWYDDLERPSSIIKANLVGYYFPRESFDTLRSNAAVVADTLIKREPGSYQFENMIVGEQFRGKGMVKRLTDFHVANAHANHPLARKIQGQVFVHNEAALHAHSKNGFVQIKIYTSANPKVETLLPNKSKVLIEKPI